MNRNGKGDTDGKGKSAGKPHTLGSGYEAPFRGYINITPDDHQKARFEAWWESASPFEALEGFVTDGIHLALRIDPKGSGFLASATQRREGSPNAGLCVTARGRSAAVAFGRVLYSLVLLSHEERWEATQPLADPDRW